MQKKFRCKICGVEYSTCPDCQRSKTWLAIVDTKKCWGIYTAVTEYRLNISTAAKSAAKLAEAGVTADSLAGADIKPEVKEAIRGIFEAAAVKPRKSKVVATLDEVKTESTDNTED